MIFKVGAEMGMIIWGFFKEKIPKNPSMDSNE